MKIKWLDLIKQAWKQFLASQKTEKTTSPAPTTPAATTPATATLLPKPSSLCQPEFGPECANPFGLDIRCLAWGRNNKGVMDWCFAACPEWSGSMRRDGNTISAQPFFVRNGIKYVCAGWKAPSSEGTLQPNLAGTYKTTFRWYYWPTREGLAQ